jgi:hypothetical protein
MDAIQHWNAALANGKGFGDPRVQAFLSSSTEGLAVYLAQLAEKQAVLERFLEVGPGRVQFRGIGQHGEITLEADDERYIVLTEDEAMQIAVDRISSGLWQEDAQRLLMYSSLPDDAIDILQSAQQNPADKANEILLGIIDVTALAEDAVRQRGYGAYVAEDVTDDFFEQRFGDLVIVRLRPGDEDEED